MRTAILRSGIFLTVAALGSSAATAQTEFSFAAGVDSTGWARAQSNANGHVLIESPQYPHGLWLHLVDEAGDALAGIQVEYQGRADSLVVLRCVDPGGRVRETLVWTRPEGDSLRLTLKPKEFADLPAGLIPIDWQIDLPTESLLAPVAETRLIGWEGVATFLQAHWQAQTGRVAVQLDTSITLAVDLGHSESIEILVNYLQDQARTSLGEINASTVQVLLNAQVFNSDLALPEGVLILSTSFIVLFEDPNLEKRVLQALSRREGPITLPETASLTSLSFYGSSVHSLAGLEHFVALETLRISTHYITDVSPLAALTNLESLNLETNQITDVSPLATLTNLSVLSLFNNQIADVSPLAALTNLESLNLETNQITDVNPLTALTNLEKLYLGGNQIADVSPLAALTNLEKLNLETNQITDVKPLTALTNLESLRLFYNQITDVKPLTALTNLEKLYLGGNQITDVKPLTALTNLESLSLGGNQITDVKPLTALTNLYVLYLGFNQIADVNSLTVLTNLESLYLDANQIADVNPLATLTNLESLHLFYNQITDVNPLTALTNLEKLNLGSNQITDVNPLATLTNLESLRLFYNQITDVKPLTALTNLKSLYLESNQITDVNPLAALTNLESLGLDSNQIEDISPLTANTGLGDGDFVSLINNPLSDQSRTKHIPALQARGVQVEY